jgi:antitoxin MazE
MKREITISKWGNSLAVRIPRPLAREAHLNEGASVALSLGRDGSIVLRSTRRRYQLAQIVSRITPKNRHGQTEWGPPQGRESW